MKRTTLACLVPLTIASLAAAPSASAAQVTKRQAQAVAKRAAGSRVERLGITYPASAWRAPCYARRAGGWRCEVGTGGQCSGEVTVVGSGARPRASRVDVWCFE